MHIILADTLGLGPGSDASLYASSGRCITRPDGPHTSTNFAETYPPLATAATPGRRTVGAYPSREACGSAIGQFPPPIADANPRITSGTYNSDRTEIDFSPLG